MLRTLFKCGGTDLPLPLMLMAKLLALYVLGHLVWIALPEPFLPFVPALDHLRHTPFSLVLKVTALLGAIAVLFNYRVRFACFLIGAAILLGILSSRLYFLNGRLYLASLLILTGLYEPKTGPWLVRAQVVLVFFSAALNKVLDQSWRNGQFMAYWSSRQFVPHWYLLISHLPDKFHIPLAMSWLIIAMEFSLVGLAFRRFRPYATRIGLLLFAGLEFFTGQTFGFFYFAPISFIAFASWPASISTVLYDGDCGFCNQTRRVMEWLDFDRLFEWQAFQNADDLHGILEDSLQKRLYAIIGENKYSGFAAFKMMFLYNPLTYIALLIVLSPGHLPFFPDYQRAVFTLPLLFLFSRFFAPFGEFAYDIVASNRHHISHLTGGISCTTKIRAGSAEQ